MNKSKKEEKKAYAKGRKAGKSLEEISEEIDCVMLRNRLEGHEVNLSRKQNRLKGWQEQERRKSN
jgi:hypothetical protein